jgi:hypothetical protein
MVMPVMAAKVANVDMVSKITTAEINNYEIREMLRMIEKRRFTESEIIFNK